MGSSSVSSSSFDPNQQTILLSPSRIDIDLSTIPDDHGFGIIAKTILEEISLEFESYERPSVFDFTAKLAINIVVNRYGIPEKQLQDPSNLAQAYINSLEISIPSILAQDLTKEEENPSIISRIYEALSSFFTQIKEAELNSAPTDCYTSSCNIIFYDESEEEEDYESFHNIGVFARSYHDGNEWALKQSRMRSKTIQNYNIFITDADIPADYDPITTNDM